MTCLLCVLGMVAIFITLNEYLPICFEPTGSNMGNVFMMAKILSIIHHYLASGIMDYALAHVFLATVDGKYI